MRFTLKNLRFLQYIDYQNVRKTDFLGCQSQDYALTHDFRFLSYGDSSILFRSK